MNPQPLTQTTKKRDIRELIQSDGVKAQLAMVLPKHMTADRMARVALTAILKTPKLLDCRPESLLQALMLCSQAGLEPDGRNAHLIPFGDQVQVIFDYKGLIALAERNGVKNIRAVTVCDSDSFSFSIEDGVPKLKHVIDWKRDRGAAYAYYGTCIRNDQFDVEVMTKGEIDKIRQRSRAGNNGPWVTDYDQMALKTVLRRMSKRWDLTAELADAVSSDADTPADIRVTAANLDDIRLPSFTPKPIAEAPKPEPIEVAAPVKAPEPAEVAAPEAPAPPAEAPPADAPAPEAAPVGNPPTAEPQEAATDADALASVLFLAKGAGIQADTVMEFCHRNKLCKPNQTELSQLADSKLKNLIKSWSNILPELQKLETEASSEIAKPQV